MLIIHGTKISRRSCGPTSHFCPVCRGVCEAELIHVLKASHVYFVPLGSGKQIYSELKCHGCESLLAATTNYEVRRPESPQFRPRLALEERMHEGRASPEERLALIEEPIRMLNYECRVLARKTSAQSVTALVQLSAVVLAIAAVILSFLYFTESNQTAKAELFPWLLGVSLATLIAFPLMIYLMRRLGRRQAREIMLPRIAWSFLPIAPMPEEIEDVLVKLRKKKNIIARALTTEDIWEAMEGYDDAGHSQAAALGARGQKSETSL